jgi:hypothetical protein
VANRPAFRAQAQLPVLLRAFARSTRIDSLFRSQQQAHLAYSVEYTPAVRRDAATVLRYARVTARTDLFRFGERSKTIVIPNLLMARGASVSFVLDTTVYIVEGPQNVANLDPHEIIRSVTYRSSHDPRHAPLQRKANAALDGVRNLPTIGKRITLADFIDENLIDAIALRYREDRRESEAARGMAMERVRAGFVLVPYFIEQLSRYEAQNESLRAYYPRLLEQLDGARELARWRDSIR